MKMIIAAALITLSTQASAGYFWNDLEPKWDQPSYQVQSVGNCGPRLITNGMERASSRWPLAGQAGRPSTRLAPIRVTVQRIPAGHG